MSILAILPMGNNVFMVRRKCGYYLEENGEVSRLDTHPAHDIFIGKIPANEHRKGGVASGEIEAK